MTTDIVDFSPYMDRPENKSELRRRVQQLILCGKQFPIITGDGKGTGAPGRCLERLLGSRGNNKAMADSVGIEVKYHAAKGGSPLTLNHTEVCGGSESIRPFLLAHGYDRNGTVTLQHTVRGRSKKFYVVREDNKIVVRPHIAGPEVYWFRDELFCELIKKMDHAILVYGIKSIDAGQPYVRFVHAVELSQFRLSYLDEAICNGDLVIDFDVHQLRPGSYALRNHGTKARLFLKNLDRFWGKVTVLATNESYQKMCSRKQSKFKNNIILVD